MCCPPDAWMCSGMCHHDHMADQQPWQQRRPPPATAPRCPWALYPGPERLEAGQQQPPSRSVLTWQKVVSSRRAGQSRPHGMSNRSASHHQRMHAVGHPHMTSLAGHGPPAAVRSKFTPCSQEAWQHGRGSVPRPADQMRWCARAQRSIRPMHAPAPTFRPLGDER